MEADTVPDKMNLVRLIAYLVLWQGAISSCIAIITFVALKYILQKEIAAETMTWTFGILFLFVLLKNGISFIRSVPALEVHGKEFRIVSPSGEVLQSLPVASLRKLIVRVGPMTNVMTKGQWVSCRLAYETESSVTSILNLGFRSETQALSLQALQKPPIPLQTTASFSL